MLACDGEVLVCDPGSEVYKLSTFSDQRYRSAVHNSCGHSVPVLAGRLQELTLTDERDTLRFDLSRGYEVPDLVSYVRQFDYERAGTGKITITDRVEFESAQAFETAVITHRPIQLVKDGLLYIGEGENRLRLDIGRKAATLSRACRHWWKTM